VTVATDYLCHACVEDRFLKAEIKAEGSKAVCMRCGKKRLAMDFVELTLRIDDAIQEHFVPTSGDEGQGYAELVGEHAQIDIEIAEQMRQGTSW
jgi:DNA-directed RNA polymerase subunit RPC12/RpoP